MLRVNEGRCKMENVQPEKVMEIMCQHGENVTLEEAKRILDFLRRLADIAVEQYLNNES